MASRWPTRTTRWPASRLRNRAGTRWEGSTVVPQAKQAAAASQDDDQVVKSKGRSKGRSKSKASDEGSE